MFCSVEGSDQHLVSTLLNSGTFNRAISVYLKDKGLLKRFRGSSTLKHDLEKGVSILHLKQVLVFFRVFLLAWLGILYFSALLCCLWPEPTMMPRPMPSNNTTRALQPSNKSYPTVMAPDKLIYDRCRRLVNPWNIHIQNSK